MISLLLPRHIYVIMIVSWMTLFVIRICRIKRKKSELSRIHFAESLLQSFGVSTLLGGLVTSIDCFILMFVNHQPIVVTESVIYSSLAFGIISLCLVIYFFYYPLPD